MRDDAERAHPYLCGNCLIQRMVKEEADKGGNEVGDGEHEAENILE